MLCIKLAACNILLCNLSHAFDRLKVTNLQHLDLCAWNESKIIIYSYSKALQSLAACDILSCQLLHEHSECKMTSQRMMYHCTVLAAGYSSFSGGGGGGGGGFSRLSIDNTVRAIRSAMYSNEIFSTERFVTVILFFLILVKQRIFLKSY